MRSERRVDRRNSGKGSPFEFGKNKRTIRALVVSRAQCLSFVIAFERLQDLPMKAVQPALGIPVIIPVYDIAALIVAEA